MTYPGITQRFIRIGTFTTATLLPAMALAHPGHGVQSGFMAGLLHPLSGVDHLAAMLALGIWAGTLQQRTARWSAPVAFVLMMLVGGVMGMQGVPLPGVERGIAASVLAFGLLLAARVQLGAALAAILASIFAVFHGHAHGTEAAGAEAVSYLGGFAISTMALHLLGMWAASQVRVQTVRMAGAALAVGGIALLAL